MSTAKRRVAAALPAPLLGLVFGQAAASAAPASSPVRVQASIASHVPIPSASLAEVMASLPEAPSIQLGGSSPRQTIQVNRCEISGAAYKIGDGSTRSIWSESTIACALPVLIATTSVHTYKVDGQVSPQPPYLTNLSVRQTPANEAYGTTNPQNQTSAVAIDSQNCGSVPGDYAGTDCTLYFLSDWKWQMAPLPGQFAEMPTPPSHVTCIPQTVGLTCAVEDRIWGHPDYFRSAI